LYKSERFPFGCKKIRLELELEIFGTILAARPERSGNDAVVAEEELDPQPLDAMAIAPMMVNKNRGFIDILRVNRLYLI
jgi:hypothetical protein